MDLDKLMSGVGMVIDDALNTPYNTPEKVRNEEEVVDSIMHYLFGCSDRTFKIILK